MAKTLHFPRAAEQTYVTQPSLSGPLGDLEDKSGVPPVARSRAKLILTLERGHRLHDQVPALCDQLGAITSQDYGGSSNRPPGRAVRLCEGEQPHLPGPRA